MKPDGMKKIKSFCAKIKEDKNTQIIMAILVVCMLFLGIKIYQEYPKKEIEIPTKIDVQTEANIKISNPIDFDAYQMMNSDVYAYLYIQDSVDTPILQHPTDNEHYLNYMLDGTQAYPGAVYTELYNKKDFNDPNTIIYGHNDDIGHSMLYGITKYEDPTFFEQQRYLYIYTPTSILQYEVFAAYVNDNSHVYFAVDDWNDKMKFQNYLNQIRSIDGNIRKDVEITKNDRIVTLSTCTVAGDNRFLVQAVLKQQIECPQKTMLETVQELEQSKAE